MDDVIVSHEYTVIIVVSTYNHEKYIDDALKGILLQKTDFAFLAVIFDDCSNDGTTEKIRQYEKEYPEVFRGVYFSENQHSQGKHTLENYYPYIINNAKYVAWCDGDDYWIDSLKLQKQVDFMDEHHDYSLCFHCATEHWEFNDIEDKVFGIPENNTYSGYDLFKNWIVPTSSIMIRAEITKDKLFYSYLHNKKIIYQDIVLLLLCAAKGKTYGMRDIMSVYRRSEHSITMNDLSHSRSSFEVNMKFSIHYLTIRDLFRNYFENDFQKRCVDLFFPFNYNCFVLSIQNHNKITLKETLKLAYSVSFFKTINYYSRRLFVTFCTKCLKIDITKIRNIYRKK